MRKYSKKWWKEWFTKASIRALHTFLEVLISMVSVEGFALLEVQWGKTLLVCLISALLSYAKSFVVGIPELEEV